MADVFISYHPDSSGKIVGKIADTLESVGVSYWYAPKRFYDKNALGKITREIRECKVFLLILNEHALKSSYVRSETALAFRRAINYEPMTFLSFRVDDCDWKGSPISYYFSRFQVMNGAPPDGEHIRELCERVARIVGGKASRRPAETEPNRVAENL